jgi:uncharacterized surface protein with fasciclin (FAS1) repeats
MANKIKTKNIIKMKTNLNSLLSTGLFLTLLMWSCNSDVQTNKSTSTSETLTAYTTGQSAVEDTESQNNVVQVAVGSPDHSTLVTAVKAAALVDALTNAGPFTVFAPTNAAFDELPAGTVEGLLKPDNKSKLQDILQYHVYVGVLPTDYMDEGQVLGQVNGGKVTIGMEDGTYTVNGAKILASVPASNGIIHVIDQVLLPPAKN